MAGALRHYRDELGRIVSPGRLPAFPLFATPFELLICENPVHSCSGIIDPFLESKTLISITECKTLLSITMLCRNQCLYMHYCVSIYQMQMFPPLTPRPPFLLSRYLTRSTTFTVNPTKASLASLSGNRSTNALASPANLLARLTVRSKPSLRVTISRATSTSPGAVNFRSMSGPKEGFCSHAKRAGAVARPSRRSAPDEGLPRVGEGR